MSQRQSYCGYVWGVVCRLLKSIKINNEGVVDSGSSLLSESLLSVISVFCVFSGKEDKRQITADPGR